MNDLAGFEIDIEDEQDLKELADKYQVSVQALTVRITSVLNDQF